MINMDELEQNSILLLKYISNRQIFPKFKKQVVSKEVKNILIELCNNNIFNNKLQEALDKQDKPFVYDLMNSLHLDVGLKPEGTDKQKVYDILLGELKSGNNNPKVKMQLKSLISEGMNSKEIPYQQGLKILEEINKP